MTLKLNRQQKGLKPYKNNINGDPVLTLTFFFYDKVKFVPVDFWMGKM